MTSPTPTRSRILWFNVFFLTVFPVLAIVATLWYALTIGITWREVTGACILWVLTGLGITAGYHRLFSHRGYKAHKFVRFLYAMLGAAAGQNSVIAWCSDHRHHHTQTDTDLDPYNAKRGFWYSHIGWIFVEGVHGDAYDNVPDLRRDPVLAWQHEHYVLAAVAVNVFLIGLMTLFLGRGLGMVIVAGMLRVVVVQHFTFLINSAAHYWGSQPWSDSTTSRDNWVLSFFTFGEGYHNYHHSFQFDYRNGPRWYNFDPTKWLIWGLSKVGLTSDLRRTPMDVVLQRRFDERRRHFALRLEHWTETRSEEWKALVDETREQLLARRDHFFDGLKEGRTALRDQLLAAEASMELSLTELKNRRAALKEALRRHGQANTDELKERLHIEMKHLKRALREAQRSAKAAMRGWQSLVEEYSLALATPAAA